MRGNLDILTDLLVNKENIQFYTIVSHKIDVAQSIFDIFFNPKKRCEKLFNWSVRLFR